VRPRLPALRAKPQPQRQHGDRLAAGLMDLKPRGLLAVDHSPLAGELLGGLLSETNRLDVATEQRQIGRPEMTRITPGHQIDEYGPLPLAQAGRWPQTAASGTGIVDGIEGFVLAHVVPDGFRPVPTGF